MTKTELSAALAEKLGIAKYKAAEAIDALFSPSDGVIVRELTDRRRGHGDEIQITGFGSFSAVVRPAKEQHDPRDPTKRIQVPARYFVRFKAGRPLREALAARPVSE